jgi:hypothetical protein
MRKGFRKDLMKREDLCFTSYTAGSITDYDMQTRCSTLTP